jgi:hypothetical protein
MPRRVKSVFARLERIIPAMRQLNPNPGNKLLGLFALCSLHRNGEKCPLFGFPASTGGGADVVEGDGAGAEEDEGKSESSQS